MPPTAAAHSAAALSPDDLKFLDELSRRNFRFFREKADSKTGLVLDRAPFDGSKGKGPQIASIASTGFGLSSLCVAAERGWISRKEAVASARKTLAFAATLPNERGWLYHFVDSKTGARAWSS